jgi:hypothetical protein
MKLRAHHLLAVLAAAVAIAFAGCGGGDDKSSSTAASSAGTTTTAQSSQKQSGDGSATEGSGSGGSSTKLALGSPSDVPRSEGGDNSIQDYGSEASTADRAAAGRALQDFYDALGRGDTEAACAMLTSHTREGIQQTIEQLQGQGGNLPKTCPQILKLTVSADQHSPQLQIDLLLSLRRQGDDAFLIYKAGDGKVRSIAMSEENGTWKVGGVSATPLGA